MADQEWKKRLNDPGYKNWLKVSLALIESKEALHDFTKNVMLAVHNDIKTKVGPGICNGTCNTNRGAPSCPSCSQWVREIKAKSGGMLQWKNADPKIWHNTPWEVAKCYMNPQGSKATAALNTGPDKTDLSGMLNVLVNCKEFGLNHLKEKKSPEHVRTVRNELMHCATMSFNDAEMKSKVDIIIKLLEDDKELKNLPICQEKVKALESVKDDEFELKPKEEGLCIDTALQSHALCLESGEEIDDNMKSFFNKLTEIIKGNKDLENKFENRMNKLDKKLMDVKEETAAQLSSFNISLGDLKGKVEFLLMEKLGSGSSFPINPTSSVLGSREIMSLFKNALQSYTQKKKLDLPKYHSHEGEGKLFVSTVLVDGKEFKSKEPKHSKKEAEQSAAEEALRSLGSEDSDDYINEKNESPSIEPQTMDISRSPSTEPHLATEESIKPVRQKENYKNKLQERAQMLKIPCPIYDDKKTDTGFLSDVMYNGRWYSPDISPQNKKIDAQQKAAQFVLAVLDSEEEKSDLATNNTSPSRPNGASDMEGREVTPPKNALKPFKVILNEHVQKITKGQLPKYDVVKDSDGKFFFTVEVFGKVYKSPSGMNSIGDAKESAASEACKVLELAEAVLENSLREEDQNSEKEQTPAVEPLSDEICGITRQEFLTEEVTRITTSNASPPSVVRPDGKTYKSMLNEYAQQHGVKSPKYEEIPGAAQEYRSRVKILDKTFECVGAYSSKKLSREMAAMEAMKYFDGLSTDNCFKTNDAVADNTAVAEADIKAPPGTEVKETTTVCEFSSNASSAISTIKSEAGSSTAVESIKITTVNPVSLDEQVPSVKRQSEPEVTDNPDGQQSSPLTPKPQPNFKNILQEFVQKQKLPALRYVNTQNPTTKEHLSKVFIGKRCFKGKQSKAKVKEAEKHVAEIAMNTLEGPGGELDSSCEELLNTFHKPLDFPMFPKYEEAACNDGRKFSVEVKVIKKYEIVCKDTKPKKKDVEMLLAEQALKRLEEEKKITPVNENAKSRLNLLLQSHGTHSKLKYDVQGELGVFSGRLCFYFVDAYESLTSQSSKEEATTSAAMSACNGMDLL